CHQDRRLTASRACTMAFTRLATSGRAASSRTKFGGMAVPAAQLDLGRPFQEELSCPSMNAAKYSFVRTALSSPNRYLLNSSSLSSIDQPHLLHLQTSKMKEETALKRGIDAIAHDI